MALPTAPVIRERLDALRDELTRRGHDHVAIVAVTKAHPAALLSLAVEAGCDAIGENYAQELRDKAPAIEELGTARPDVHFIGQLQSNKVRLLAGLVDLWESVDRTAVLDELAKRAPRARVLIQVNATGEPHKGGCAPAEIETLLGHARDRKLEVRGLMTIGPTRGGDVAARAAFRTVRRLADTFDLPVCSMGMTGDYHVAIDEGTTEIRVGSLLFGPRPQRDGSTR